VASKLKVAENPLAGGRTFSPVNHILLEGLGGGRTGLCKKLDTAQGMPLTIFIRG
jgi:hypothetical protein